MTAPETSAQLSRLVERLTKECARLREESHGLTAALAEARERLHLVEDDLLVNARQDAESAFADLKMITEKARRMVAAFDVMTGENGLSIGMSPGRECRIFDEAIDARNELNGVIYPPRTA